MIGKSLADCKDITLAAMISKNEWKIPLISEVFCLTVVKHPGNSARNPSMNDFIITYRKSLSISSAWSCG
jgi:hypothetical protein